MKYLAAVVACLAVASPAWADETQHFNQSLRLPAGGSVRIRGFAGHVAITARDGDEVSVDAIRRGSREWLDGTKLELYLDGSTMVIRDNRDVHFSWFQWPRHDSIGSTDFEIRVPRRTNLDVNVFSAPVAVDGVNGHCTIHSFSGKVSLRDVAGSVQTKTFSGSVDVQASRWMDPETIDVDTFSGGVELRLPRDARGAVSFHSFSGHLDSDVPLTTQSSNRRDIEAQLGGGGSSSRLRVKTFSGSLRIDQ